MSGNGSSQRGLDDLEGGASPARAKPIVRRSPPAWREADGVWRAAIGPWTVAVAELPGAGTWEWTAFAGGQALPRAVGGRGFSEREAAQLDAEATLARIA